MIRSCSPIIRTVPGQTPRLTFSRVESVGAGGARDHEPAFHRNRRASCRNTDQCHNSGLVVNATTADAVWPSSFHSSEDIASPASSTQIQLRARDNLSGFPGNPPSPDLFHKCRPSATEEQRDTWMMNIRERNVLAPASAFELHLDVKQSQPHHHRLKNNLGSVSGRKTGQFT
jgi:hypothetical protein